APGFLARTHAGWARALLARGQPEDLERARHMLEQAEQTAARLGAEGIAREVAESHTALVTVTREALRTAPSPCRYRRLHATASCGGREVKNTGDGLMVAFSSASAAVECGVAMQQLFERRYRDAEQALHVRIGLAAGESTVKDGDYFGAPSIEAARLCAQAPA